MSNLRHLIRGISQLDVKPKNPDSDLSKYDKYIARLKAPISLAESVATANKLVLWITQHQLGNPSQPWLVGRRLVRSDMPNNARLAGLELYKACVQSRPDLPVVARLIFFKDIEATFAAEDFDHKIEAFNALSKNGRDISGFDANVCSFLAKWLDQAHMNLDVRKAFVRRMMPITLPARHQELRTVIGIVISIIKFHSAILEEADLAILVEKIVLTCKRTGDSEDIQEALAFFDAMIRYSYIPLKGLYEVVSVICSVYHALPTHQVMALSVVLNMLKSHMSQGTLRALRYIVQRKSNVHDDVILGALGILTTRWTQNNDEHASYTFTIEALFSSLKQGLESPQVREDRDQVLLDVGYLEVVFEILGNDSVSNTLSFDDWNTPFEIIMLCSRSLQIPAGRRLEAELTSVTSAPINKIYAKLLTLLERLAAEKRSNLPMPKLAELWTALRFVLPTDSAMLLLKYHTTELSCYPSNPRWLETLETLGLAFLSDLTQAQDVRLAYVKILRDANALVATTPSEPDLHMLILRLLDEIGAQPETQSSIEAVYLILEILDSGLEECSAGAAALIRKLLMGSSNVLRDSGEYTNTLSRTKSPQPQEAEVKLQALVDPNRRSDPRLGDRIRQTVIKELIDLFIRKFCAPPSPVVLVILDIMLDVVYSSQADLSVRLKALAILSHFRADSEHILYLDTTMESHLSLTENFSSAEHVREYKSHYTCLETRGDQSLPVSRYAQVLCALLTQETDPRIILAITQVMKHQLNNQQLFVDSKEQILQFRKVVCDRLTMAKGASSASNELRTGDFLTLYVQVLALLVGYHDLFNKSQEDEIVAALQITLNRDQKATAACIHAMTICAYEIPLSTTKTLSTILIRLSQLVTSTKASVHILEFLSSLAKLPNQYVNFREEDYRRVFGITLQHIQFANASIRDALANEQSNPLIDSMFTYNLILAFDTLYAWFLALKMSQRPRFVKFIVDGLLSANPQSKSLDVRGQVCYDFLARFCYSNSDIKSSTSVLREFEADQSSMKSWLHGCSIVTMKTMNLSGLTEITVRRPSGSASYLCKPNSDLEALSIISSSDAKSIVSKETIVGPTELKIRSVISGLEATAFTPSHILLQTSVSPELFQNEKPILLVEDDTTRRSIATLDRIPVVDFHKIGVVYVGRGQSTQNEILSNTYGSPEYVQFLEQLGDLVRLKNNTSIYTGGLDTSGDQDGEFAYAFRGKISQIIFHTCTLMPTRPEVDPEFNSKKAHIGNDFVNIIWNSSNQPFNPQTIPSEFNFVNIVVSPTAYQATRIYSDPSGAQEQFFQIKIVSHRQLPEISPILEWRLVSASKISEFVRSIAIHCNLYAQIYHARGDYISTWSQRLERINTLRNRTLAKAVDEMSNEDAKSSGYDFTSYN